MRNIYVEVNPPTGAINISASQGALLSTNHWAVLGMNLLSAEASLVVTGQKEGPRI